MYSHADHATTRDPAKMPSNVFLGQVALVAPDQSLNYFNVSHSYGVVVVKQESVWQYIIKKGDYVDQAVTDTLCREMGYTHTVLNSVMNLGLSDDIYNSSNYTYDLSTMWVYSKG